MKRLLAFSLALALFSSPVFSFNLSSVTPSANVEVAPAPDLSMKKFLSDMKAQHAKVEKVTEEAMSTYRDYINSNSAREPAGLPPCKDIILATFPDGSLLLFQTDANDDVIPLSIVNLSSKEQFDSIFDGVKEIHQLEVIQNAE